MAYYYLKVIAPRTTFADDITEAEQALMNEHFKYWQDLTNDGAAVVFGPVLDPEGIFGIGVVETLDVESAERIAMQDPAVRAGVVRMTVSPMRVGGIRSN